MHPIRRRKKRPNYGVRTVEVSRGKNGFGFTISGQHPCILSCIVAGSPAEKAGLRPGDYLVAVNGQSVSKVPHDDVVRLIGCSSGVLKLQIAENYYSDSSDEDAIIPARPKPKYMHKPRNGGQNQRSTAIAQQSRGTKIVRVLRTGAMFEEQPVESSAILQSPGKSKPPLPQHWEPPLPPPRLYPLSQTEKPCEPDRDKVEYRALVGYLGTIEMPKELLPGSRLQVVRSCIKRLRTEKRAHTLVLMSVYTRSLTLTNCHKVTLAEYPSDRVTFCGTSSDEERRFFGIITTAVRPVEDDNDGGELVHSSSCHVFAIELRLHGSHGEHAAKADAFKLHCNVDATTGFCSEFPSSSDPIVSAIKVLYSSQETGPAGNRDVEEPLVANSPQPSNASSTATTASSNSDSGIGFRDDCGNQSDRILVVDVQNQRLHIQQMVNDNHETQQSHISGVHQPKSCVYELAGSANSSRLAKHPDDRLTVRVMPDPVMNLSGALAVSNRSRSPLSSASSEDNGQEQKTNPHIEMYSERAVDVPVYDFSNYHGGTVLGNSMTARSNDDMSISSGTNKSQDQLNLTYKNKYKDFMTNKTVSQSFSANFQEKSANGANFKFPSFSGVIKSVKSVDAMSVGSGQSHDMLLSCKLSPKVFDAPLRPMTLSLEDLKVAEVPSDERDLVATSLSLSSSRGQHWGSLQELRSFVANCFETSPGPGDMQKRPQLKRWGVAAVTASKTFVRATTGPRAGRRFCRSLRRRSSADEGGFCKHKGNTSGVELLQDEPARGVAGWAASFEKLLGDPAGLHTFAEFLKKEFSHENIYFWVACEKYRSLSSPTERASSARDIFERHLCLGALEPVNVDSHARQAAQDGLTEAAPTLFLQAQKQIFNLMKFDSYPRFLRSELYKECLVRELSGQELPCAGGDDLDAGLQLHSTGESPNHSKLKKSRSDAEDRHRKSLLPWHRKNRSKSKDRGESEYNKIRMLQQKRDTDDTVSVRSDVTSSRSSLASWDLALRGSFSRQSVTSGEGETCCTLCRVILPDGATTVVQTRSSESIRDLILRLLDKRGLHYSAFEVFDGNSVKPLSLDEDSTVLAGKEVRVEQRAVFRLDLPNRKTVGVKAKPGKSLAEILRPILHKYGYKLELVTLCLMSENEVVELSALGMTVDNQRLQVLTRNAEAWKNEVTHTVTSQHKLKATGPTLDEITNRVFEELLQGKVTDSTHTASDQGSIRSDDWGSEHSSGIFGRFLRRDSALLDKARESRVKGKKGAGTNKHIGEESETKVVSTSNPKPPLITKWKVGVKLQGRSESDELYEGLKRAQRSRLEDQRGTEINFELPDFLKDKENAPQTGKKFRKLRRGEENTSKFYEPEPHPQSHPAVSGQESLPVGTSGSKCSYRANTSTTGALVTRLLDQSFVTEGVIPSARQAEEYFLGRRPDPSKLEKTHHGDSSETGSSLDNTLVELNPLETTLTCADARDESTRPRQHSDPPPLPPKPKHLPVKTSMWASSAYVSNSTNPPTFRSPGDGASSRFLRPTEVKKDVRVCRSRRTVYLDQPSSSFV
ncbi:regulator of G-protein signaling loco isoform X3 [Zootermopsis nevadensis]|uniref:regulator of G-protein signaling loco isoform X3 n=1 Tax=Zootermopsis nevadensis TaxID=136037 RepID=UPI000B8E60B7|nr:regulator of G-protein signaling loco isoform X3 [Zootermopsis nevadensis]